MKDKPDKIYLPMKEIEKGFYFNPADMIEAVKPLDAKPKKRNDIFEPAGDLVQVVPNHPNMCVHAYLLKDIARVAKAEGVTMIEAEIRTEALVLYFENGRNWIKWQSPEMHGAHIHIARLEKGHPPQDTPPEADPWLKKAISKDKDYREELCQVYGGIAADGWRMHIDNRLPLDLFPREIDYILNPLKNYQNIATVPVKPLIALVKGMKGIAKQGNGSIKIDLNHDRLEVSAKSEEYGITAAEITTKKGYSLEYIPGWFLINPKFLLDALSGFKDEVLISYKNERSPIHITDGVREAVIMPMNPGDE